MLSQKKKILTEQYSFLFVSPCFNSRKFHKEKAGTVPAYTYANNWFGV